MTVHPEHCGWPGAQRRACGPGGATGRTAGALAKYAAALSRHGRIDATSVLRGGRPGDAPYEVDGDGPPPPDQRHNRYTAIELRLTR
ncbi:hypothetical protein [Kitasatospora sp. NPDC002965]|uniref:hypothetical protein n=1 Tax=Kitasatospora sp. NPDC002965 TaxID=3154775 RepID=UPI0033AE6720